MDQQKVDIGVPLRDFLESRNISIERGNVKKRGVPSDRQLRGNVMGQLSSWDKF